MKKCITIKAVVLVAVILIYNMTMQFISSLITPIIVNDLAMNQMYNTADSNFWVQAYYCVPRYEPLLLTALVVIIFSREIEMFLSKLGERNEEN